jgi:hypothetical protein
MAERKDIPRWLPGVVFVRARRPRFFAPALGESGEGEVKGAIFVRDPVSQQENVIATITKNGCERELRGTVGAWL